MLRIFTEAVSVGIGKHMRPMMGSDDAMFYPCIARQTSMTMRIQGARHNPVADGETRLLANRPFSRSAGAQRLREALRPRRVFAARHRPLRVGRKLLHSPVDLLAR